MGMGSEEYYSMLYPDLLLKIEGYDMRRQQDERIMRKVAYSAYVAPHVDPKDKAKTEQSFWPMASDKETNEPKFDDKKEAFKDLLKEIWQG